MCVATPALFRRRALCSHCVASSPSTFHRALNADATHIYTRRESHVRLRVPSSRSRTYGTYISPEMCFRSCSSNSEVREPGGPEKFLGERG